MASTNLDAVAITELRGIGPQLSQKLSKLGLNSLQDLLFHLPLRYIDRTKITPIGSLQPQTDVVLEGEYVEEQMQRRDPDGRVQEHWVRVHEHAAQVLRLLLGDAKGLLIHLERVLQVHHPLEAARGERAERELKRQRSQRRVDGHPVDAHRGELVDVDERPVLVAGYESVVVQEVLHQWRHAA